MLVCCLTLSACVSAPTKGTSTINDDREPDLGPPTVIDPQLTRRIIKRFTPERGNYEIGFFGGATAIEGVSTSPTLGIAASYYFSEDFLMRLDTGVTSVSRTDYAVTLQQLNSAKNTSLTAQSISVAYNFLPGEAYFGRNAVHNCSFYVIAGLGFVDFPLVGISNTKSSRAFAQNFGAGFKVFPNDHMNLSMEIGNRLYSSNIAGYSRYSTNLETRVGINFIF